MAAMENLTPVPPTQATTYLESLLNKNLRITTTDSRMFWGNFKCTDSVSPVPPLSPSTSQPFSPTKPANTTGSVSVPHSKECNIVLKHTYEYRPPPPPKPEELAAAKSIKMDMTSRFLGLVVVPGEHIVKIEVEGFASQMKGAASAAATGTEKRQEGGRSAMPVQPAVG